MLSSSCAVCGNKKLKFIGDQEVGRLLSSLKNKNIFNSISYIFVPISFLRV